MFKFYINYSSYKHIIVHTGTNSQLFAQTCVQYLVSCVT